MSQPPTTGRVARWATALGLTREQLEVAGVVAFYMAAALVMVFVNKAVLLSTPTLPLLFLLIQLCMAVALLHVFAVIAPRHVRLPRLELAAAKSLAPIIAVSLGGLVFNTLCLRAVEAAFFQIARGLLLPLTIIISALATRALPTPTAPVFIAALIVTLGFLMGIAPSGTHPVDVVGGVGESVGVTQPVVPSASAVATPLALAYGVLSAVFIAVHSVLIKSSLPLVDGSALALAYWSNLGAATLLAPVVALGGEGAELARLVRGAQEAAIGAAPWHWSTFVWGSIVTGVFGALLGVAGMLSVKATSPVTHMFSSAGKSVLQTVLGVWIFGDLLTTSRASSIGVILLGTLYYTWVKAQQPPATPAARGADAEMAERGAKARADERARLVREDDDGTIVEFEVDDKDLE